MTTIDPGADMRPRAELGPEDGPPTNADRAGWALGGLTTFGLATGQLHHASDLEAEDWTTPELGMEVLGDFLADLLHLVGPDTMLEGMKRGLHHYACEVCRVCGRTAEDYGICTRCHEHAVPTGVIVIDISPLEASDG